MISDIVYKLGSKQDLSEGERMELVYFFNSIEPIPPLVNSVFKGGASAITRLSDISNQAGRLIRFTMLSGDNGNPYDTLDPYTGLVITSPADSVNSSNASIYYINSGAVSWYLGSVIGIKLDDLYIPDDNTDLDATTLLHGLMSKADKTKLDGLPSGSGGLIPASSISIAKISTPTVDQAQEYIDNTGSAGWFYGGTLTDAGSGNINIAAGRGFIRATADPNAQLLSFEWTAYNNVAIASNTVKYIYISYNSGSPTYVLSSSEFDEDETKIMIGVAINDAGSIDSVFNVGVRIQEGIGNAGRWMRRVFGIMRDARRGGLMFSTTGTRNVKCTAGHLWWGRTDYTINLFDTNVSGSFPIYYVNGASFSETAAATQWPNNKYDDGSGTLATLNANKWANLWFYIEPDGHIVAMYGRTTNNTQAAAELEPPPPTLPNRLQAASVLAARLTFQSGAGTGSWSSAFDTKFTPGQEQLVVDSVDNTILANMTAKTYKGRTTNSTGDPEDVPVATLKTDLGLDGLFFNRSWLGI